MGFAPPKVRQRWHAEKCFKAAEVDAEKDRNAKRRLPPENEVESNPTPQGHREMTYVCRKIAKTEEKAGNQKQQPFYPTSLAGQGRATYGTKSLGWTVSRV